MENIVDAVLDQSETEYGVAAISLTDFFDTPKEYQEYCIRIMSMAAFSENLGGEGLSLWINKAPDNARRRLVARLAYEEFDHGYQVYRLLEQLNVSEAQVDAIATGKVKTSRSIHTSLNSAEEIYGATGDLWLDLALHCVLMDTAGRYIVSNFAESSYAPWAEISKGIAQDEIMHAGFGKREFERCLLEGIPEEVLQERFTYWYARSLNFFGPPPGNSAIVLQRYGIKRKNNEELRSEFKKEIFTYLEKLGLTRLIQLNKCDYPFA